MTDLCLTCQQNTSKLLRSANLPDNEKSQCILAQQEHLNCVQTEREFYRNTCSESKNNLQRLADTIEFDEPHDPCSIDTVIHYSFDFAQQIHTPSNPMQLGPIYFKTPRKCGIFGVMSEAVPQQVNYLIDEASDVGKGANSTISYVHHYFQNHGLGETCVHLHADNCSRQNKNNCFLWYLAWRAINQLHNAISYLFLNAGHTNFGPDRSFGVIERSYKVTYISSLYEFAEMVESSSTAGVNKAQLVGTHDGKVIVPVYDWSAFLGQYFVELPSIKKFHHFRFSKEEHGKIYFKEYSTSPKRSLLLLKHPATLPPAVLPAKLNPQALSQERKQYLHREIHQLCKPGTEDLVAPLVKNFLPLKNELGIVLPVTPGVLRCLIVQRSRCFLRQTSCSPVCVPFLTGMFQISPSSTTVNGNLGQLTDAGHRVTLENMKKHTFRVLNLQLEQSRRANTQNTCFSNSTWRLLASIYV